MSLRSSYPSGVKVGHIYAALPLCFSRYVDVWKLAPVFPLDPFVRDAMMVCKFTINRSMHSLMSHFDIVQCRVENLLAPLKMGIEHISQRISNDAIHHLKI